MRCRAPYYGDFESPAELEMVSAWLDAATATAARMLLRSQCFQGVDPDGGARGNIAGYQSQSG